MTTSILRIRYINYLVVTSTHPSVRAYKPQHKQNSQASTRSQHKLDLATLAPLTPNKKTVVFSLQPFNLNRFYPKDCFLLIPIIPNLPAPVLVNVLKAT